MVKKNMNLHINMSLIVRGVDTMYWCMSGLYCRTPKLKQGKQFYKKIAAEIIGL